MPLLLALLAAAAPPTASPPITIGPTVGLPDAGVITWYMDGRGSDANTCTAPFTDGGRVGPCLTSQGAVNKTPKFLRHGVRYQHAAVADGGPQTYPCLYVTGFVQDFGYGVADAGMRFTGPLVNYYTDGGVESGTGTISSVSTDGTVRNWSTVTDGTKQWGDDALQGYLIEILSGTGVGSVVQIVGNDAGTLTTVGTWAQNAQTTPTAGSTYAIRQPGWVIATACPLPGTQLTNPTANQAGIYVDSSVDLANGGIIFDNVGFRYDAGAGLTVGGTSSVRVRNYRQVLGNGAGISTLVNSSPRILVDRGSFTGAATTYALSPLGPSQFIVTGALSYGANAGLYRSTNGVAGTPAVTMSSSRSKNSTQGGLVLFTCAQPANIQQSWFDCADSTGIGVMVGASVTSAFGSITAGSFGWGSCTAAMLNVTVGPTCGVGLGVAGPLALGISNGMSGAQVTSGYEVDWGGRVQIFSGGMTGGVQDVLLDHGTFNASLAAIATGGCQLADAGVSPYDSRLCK